jgi:hypothetical protein
MWDRFFTNKVTDASAVVTFVTKKCWFGPAQLPQMRQHLRWAMASPPSALALNRKAILNPPRNSGGEEWVCLSAMGQTWELLKVWKDGLDFYNWPFLFTKAAVAKTPGEFYSLWPPPLTHD